MLQVVKKPQLRLLPAIKAMKRMRNRNNMSMNKAADEKQKQYVDEQGNGLIKGSKSGIYHLPGSKYYEDTTNPKEWFKTIAEAEAAGYRAPK